MPILLATHLRSSWRLLAKEVAAFGVVGLISLVIDTGLFDLLQRHGPIKAKIVSAALSTTFAYFGNRYWSFSHRARTNLGRQAAFFFLINGVTLMVSIAALGFFAYPLHYRHDHFVMNVVNFVSIGIGTLIRFDAYKRFVFLHPDKVHIVAGVSDDE